MGGGLCTCDYGTWDSGYRRGVYQLLYDASCDKSDHGSPPCFVDATHTMKLSISGRGPAIVEEHHCDVPVEVQVCGVIT